MAAHQTTTATTAAARLEEVAALADGVFEAMASSVVGQRTVVRQLLAAILCGGHCLLEGVPGLAKTLIVRSLASTLGLSFGRIQFTPDLMPADITGTEVLEEHPGDGSRSFRFLRGPVFAQLLLADEINRAPPKTQSALLEAMQEGQVTAGGRQHLLPEPFVALATQNPIEQEGTYPLPEGQLDRFLFMLRIDYPAAAEELEIVRRTTGEAGHKPAAVADAETLLRASQTVRAVPLADHVMQACVDLARRTRPGDPLAPAWLEPLVAWGAGPRASQALALAAKATAAIEGRPCGELRDVRDAAHAVLRHRLVLSFEAQTERLTADAIIDRLLEE
jgi:MoxR-like ATPase